jgi:hypothetical protein
LREESGRRGHEFVDVHGPLSEATYRGRARDPAFTLIGDGVHPDPWGHEVMAGAALEQLDEGRIGEELEFAKRDGSWEAKEHGAGLERLDEEEGLPVFVYRAAGLPGGLGGGSSERVVFSGLEPGRYELSIDDETAGVWSAAELGRGISLNEHLGTAPYRQGQAVARLNAERNKKGVEALRKAWYQVKVKWYEFEESPAKFEEWFAEQEPELSNLESLIADYEDRIYAVNQPQAHEYRLVRAGGGGS